MKLGQLFSSTVFPGLCCPSNDGNLDRALYNEGSCFPVEELNIDLLIRHAPSLSDAIEVACFPVPPLSVLTS